MIKEKFLPLKHIINKNDAVCIGFKCSVIFTHDENNKKKNKHDENKTHFKKVHYVTHLKTLKHKKV